ncbi:MAG: NADH-quinone oxidoreductase subunit J [Anaerolineales bacterium]|nr:NADH-quinone oxidoreductase subunit J [Anaerolineales bacterium]
MSTDLILFLGLAVVAVVTALSMLLSRNAVHSALFLALNFLAVAVLYLLMNAAFVAMVQITVYAGAIMVLFLFVIMLLGAESAAKGRNLPWQAPVAVLSGLVLLVELVYYFMVKKPEVMTAAGTVGQDFGSPAEIGRLLFDSYTLPFELTSILLLVAMVGAIILSRNEKEAE